MDLDTHLPAILARDTGAFARWMAGAEPTIRASLRSFATTVDVEAVLQETLLRVWTVAPRFEPDGKPNGLLRMGIRIGRNLAVSETRRMRAKPAELEDLDRALSATERGVEAPDPLLRAVLAECHERLSEKPRQALDARLGAEGRVADDELARALAMRLNTFLQNLSRARKMLAECLRKHGVAIDEELGA
jgi:RNA polymerase sigma-70 factor (ECF subfamily)